MNFFTQLWNNYADIEIDIKRLIAAEFFLQIVNSAFSLSLNLFLAKEGYSDIEIANFTADRFMAVMLFALPFGLYIKARALRPIFLAGVIALPIVSLALLEAVTQHADFWLRICMIIWGICFTTVVIPSLPYILRNADPAVHTRALSLHASTWSLGLVFAGIIIFCLSHISAKWFDDKTLLQVLTIIGMGAIWQVWKMSKQEQVGSSDANNDKKISFFSKNKPIHWWQQYDWHLIGRAIIPVTLIAIGAGLTIPFMNLYFYHRFGMNTDSFALLGSVTACLVFITTLLVPNVKKKLGYKAIPITQSLAIFSLIILGTTDSMVAYSLALPLALVCFIVRQPLMSLANPMTSELTMYYVGNNNRELTGAIVSAIWSGSWFVSSYAFGVLRSWNLTYGSIFFITATFYIVGVLMYIMLIKDYRRREKAGFIAMQ